MKLDPLNLTAQLHHRALGNPETALPHTAISNCFPGLETDFRNFWRRVFVGIVLLECDNYIVDADPEYQHLVGHRLLQVENCPIVTRVNGPPGPGFASVNLTGGSVPNSTASMEWSNALSAILQHYGKKVRCYLTAKPAKDPEPLPDNLSGLLTADLTIRSLFDGESAAPAPDLLEPGELTQSLCSPWQNDYRECACYYWAASRPDYVNVEPTGQGITRGDNWMSKERNGEYILDDRKDSRLISYDDLFSAWEKVLRFQIEGRDAEAS